MLTVGAGSQPQPPISALLRHSITINDNDETFQGFKISSKLTEVYDV
jgi:hypothetical protein